MSDIHTAHDTHREDLLQEGLTVLGRYTHFSSTHRVTFSQAGDRLAIVRRTSRGALAKKDGVTGWYLGKLGPA